MCGSETFATEVSSTSMNVAVMTAMAMSHGLCAGGCQDSAWLEGAGIGGLELRLGIAPYHEPRGHAREQSGGDGGDGHHGVGHGAVADAHFGIDGHAGAKA